MFNVKTFANCLFWAFFIHCYYNQQQLLKVLSSLHCKPRTSSFCSIVPSFDRATERQFPSIRIILTHYTEVRFASFLSGGFTTMAVIKPPERKLVKRTSVHWSLWSSAVKNPLPPSRAFQGWITTTSNIFWGRNIIVWQNLYSLNHQECHI